MKEIEPIAVFRSPFSTKFGVPRQSGVVPELCGRVVFEPKYRAPEALRGLEGFDYVWLIWGFHEAAREGSKSADVFKPTVRPPRLGGNVRLGVFATRSPFRPNGLALSAVKISRIGEGEIEVLGADLMDSTPIYDVKPYLPYVDAHPEARSGFVDTQEWKPLKVIFPEELQKRLSTAELKSLCGVLKQDPRPHYHDDPTRVYGMSYGRWNVRFRISDGILTVIGI